MAKSTLEENIVRHSVHQLMLQSCWKVHAANLYGFKVMDILGTISML